ncbi:MAG: membrane protein insertase YidC [Gammaproteobacteria bacterium]
MDNTRLFLFIALSFIGLMLWDAWQKDYNTPQATAPVENPTVAESDNVDAMPDVVNAQAAPSGDLPASVVQDPTNINVASALDNANSTSFVDVTTDLFKIKINLQGGGISYAALNAYPRESKNPEVPFEFLADDQQRLFIHQNGITGTGVTPDHRAIYTTDAKKYILNAGAKELNVVLKWQDKSGLTVKKNYRFRRDSYTIDVSYDVTNGSTDVWQGRIYEQLQRAKPSSGRKLLYTFTGAAISTPEKLYEKYDYDDLQDTPINIDVTNGWVAVLEHYFVSALVPPENQKYHYYSKILDDRRYIVGMYGDPKTIAPGGQDRFQTRFYIGPKRQDILRNLTPNLDRTVDYGVLWFIGEPLFKLLQFLHKILGNWGWAIIVLTILLKLFFYPLSAAGYRSMAKMRKVQPRMMSIKERYGDDRARMNQAMMELYKEEKINPLGGCLPILVQIPVFIALYWVLLESVELRQVPFTLWLTDLTAKDPYFVLPLLMGISMWIQQKLNPAPMDPVQQKVMQLLPFVFTIFFAFFPAGLVLYWVVNNILSIIQQWRITKVIEQGK